MLQTKEQHRLQTLKNYRQRNKAKVVEYLLNHPCECGETDVRVLEFDHQRGKIKSISAMIAGHFSWMNIAAEIKKCVVRCANCHRRKTTGTPKWYIDLTGFKRDCEKTERKSTLIHGTRNGYAFHRCRCKKCRTANAQYSKQYRLL
jgi:hypothetical protein